MLILIVVDLQQSESSVGTVLPGFHLLSSSVTMSTPLIRFSQNSSRLFDSGKRPEIPAITISSMMNFCGGKQPLGIYTHKNTQLYGGKVLIHKGVMGSSIFISVQYSIQYLNNTFIVVCQLEPTQAQENTGTEDEAN